MLYIFLKNILVQKKQNYFPNLEDFEKYIQEQQFPELLAIEYKKIYTQGEYYIVTVEIEDLISKNVKKEKSFIIKENGYNDYYISLKL